MGDGERVHSDAMQRMSTEFGATQSSGTIQKPPSFSPIVQLEAPQQQQQMRARHFAHFSQNFTSRAAANPPHHNQMPPLSPYSQIPLSRPANQQFGLPNFGPLPSHSRSLSQPSSAFSFDLLPPLSPASLHSSSASISDHVSTDVSMEDKDAISPCNLPPSAGFSKVNYRASDALPPRKVHRRSISDIPPGFFSGSTSMGKPSALVKKEWEKGVDGNPEGTGERKSEGDVVDDLFSAYMNLDNIDMLNSSGTDDRTGNETRDDVDSSRASGSKTNACESSDNEAESSVNESSKERTEGIKRTARGGVASTSRHYRSVSMDSFVGKLKISDESPKLSPSPGSKPGQLSPTNSMDENAFSLEFGSGEFSGAELKKIMANEKLAEIALADPKRAKRILANRQSAARSKERKMRYISELEHKVQTLQTEATTLSAQLTHLQRDSIGLTNQNNELKFRLQAMEQQAHLRDALNEALTAEVRRLKLATAEMGESSSKPMIQQQLSMNPQIYQSNSLNLHQMQAQQPPKQQNGNPESSR